MIRTQIYLTRAEKEALQRLSDALGRSQSQLIREAIDRYVAEQTAITERDAFQRGFGLWADRTDLPDFAALRQEWDRQDERS